jgi:hypothetical protein
MKNLFVCVVLMLVLVFSTQAYGFGHHGGHDPDSKIASGSVNTVGTVGNSNSESLRLAQDGNSQNNTYASVPEPSTLFLFFAGLSMIVILKRKLV